MAFRRVKADPLLEITTNISVRESRESHESSLWIESASVVDSVVIDTKGLQQFQSNCNQFMRIDKYKEPNRSCITSRARIGYVKTGFIELLAFPKTSIKRKLTKILFFFQNGNSNVYLSTR